MTPIFVDVDTQRDFCEQGGALLVPGSPNEAFRRLTELAVGRSVPILGSVDSHAYDAWEFGSNDNLGPEGEDPRFPDHCVKGTEGWLKVAGTLPPRFRFLPPMPDGPIQQLVAELLCDRGAHALYFEKEVYSLFANPLAEPLVAELTQHLAAPRFYVYGVATDYCVKAAALGLASRGYDTVLLTDAVAGITDAGVEAALIELHQAGVCLLTIADLLATLTA